MERNLLKSGNHITTAQISKTLGVSDRMVRKHITALKEKGLITRIGSNKTGHWETNK